MKLQRYQINFYELHFHVLYAVLFCFSNLKIIGHWNHDNNLESLCATSLSRVEVNSSETLACLVPKEEDGEATFRMSEL
jgi:hypothetical protein